MSTSIDDFLAHYGVLGMHWGVRKSTVSGQNGKSTKRRTPDQVQIDKRKQLVARRRTLSDKDLDAIVQRLKTEKQFRELTAQDIAPGKTKALEIIGKVGKDSLAVIGTGVVVYGVRAAFQRKFSFKEAASFIKLKK